jgi:hypothetical protein
MESDSARYQGSCLRPFIRAGDKETLRVEGSTDEPVEQAPLVL